MKIRSHYNYDQEQNSNECCVKDFGPSQTIQSMTDDADLNVIMDRMGVNMQMPPPGDRLPQYIDYTDVFDYRTALMQLKAAQEHFMSYPAKLRAEFDNDPGVFLQFCENPANRPRMKELGLLKPDAPAPETSHDAKEMIKAIKEAKTINSQVAPSGPPSTLTIE